MKSANSGENPQAAISQIQQNTDKMLADLMQTSGGQIAEMLFAFDLDGTLKLDATKGDYIFAHYGMDFVDYLIQKEVAVSIITHNQNPLKVYDQLATKLGVEIPADLKQRILRSEQQRSELERQWIGLPPAEKQKYSGGFLRYSLATNPSYCETLKSLVDEVSALLPAKLKIVTKLDFTLEDQGLVPTDTAGVNNGELGEKQNSPRMTEIAMNKHGLVQPKAIVIVGDDHIETKHAVLVKQHCRQNLKFDPEVISIVTRLDQAKERVETIRSNLTTTFCPTFINRLLGGRCTDTTQADNNPEVKAYEHSVRSYNEFSEHSSRHANQHNVLRAEVTTYELLPHLVSSLCQKRQNQSKAPSQAAEIFRE